MSKLREFIGKQLSKPYKKSIFESKQKVKVINGTLKGKEGLVSNSTEDEVLVLIEGQYRFIQVRDLTLVE